jgi:hypothetical protein
MRHLPLAAAILATITAPSVACGQIRASEHSTLTQRVSTTTITIEGDRPVARGRKLFGDGGVVRWGEVWTPGANWATTLEVDRDVTIDGKALPKGKYSLWLTPKAPPAAWSLAFSRDVKRFHTRPPGAADEQLRIDVKPEQSPMHMETLAWYMPIVTPDGVTLRLHWGTTVVPLRIGVEMPRLVTLPEDQVPQYVGTYKVHMTPRAGTAYDVDFVIRDDAGTLRLKSQPRDVFGGEVYMVPVVDGRFHVAYTGGEMFKGRPFVEPGMIFAFRIGDGHATGFDMYGYDETVVGKGEVAK